MFEITNRTLSFREVAARYGVYYVYFLDLPENILGCYRWELYKPPAIAISKRIERDPILSRCVFFEELGHHVTATNEKRKRPFKEFCMTERTTTTGAKAEVIEKQALRWASVQLISDLEIRWFIRDGGGTLEDLARRFQVTEEIAVERLNVLSSSNNTLWRYLLRFMADRAAGHDITDRWIVTPEGRVFGETGASSNQPHSPNFRTLS